VHLLSQGMLELSEHSTKPQKSFKFAFCTLRTGSKKILYAPWNTVCFFYLEWFCAPFSLYMSHKHYKQFFINIEAVNSHKISVREASNEASCMEGQGLC
jgi:hypothetical protein